MTQIAAQTEVLVALDALYETLTQGRDAEAAMKLFVDDDDIVMWGSDEPEQAVGQAAVAELHRGVAAFPGSFAFRWHTHSGSEPNPS